MKLLGGSLLLGLGSLLFISCGDGEPSGPWFSADTINNVKGCGNLSGYAFDAEDNFALELYIDAKSPAFVLDGKSYPTHTIRVESEGGSYVYQSSNGDESSDTSSDRLVDFRLSVVKFGNTAAITKSGVTVRDYYCNDIAHPVSLEDAIEGEWKVKQGDVIFTFPDETRPGPGLLNGFENDFDAAYSVQVQMKDVLFVNSKDNSEIKIENYTLDDIDVGWIPG